jgi:hypothetical protein
MSGIDNEGLHIMSGDVTKDQLYGERLRQAFAQSAPRGPMLMGEGVRFHHRDCVDPDHLADTTCIRADGMVLGVPEPDEPVGDFFLRTVRQADDRLVGRCGVGGPLHGRIVRVPLGSTQIMTARTSEPLAVPLPPMATGDIAAVERLSESYTALTGVVTYHVRERGGARLLIEAELLASSERVVGKANRLGETIVEALAIASGVHGHGGPLVKTLPPPEFDD